MRTARLTLKARLIDFFDTTSKQGLCQDADFLVGSNTDNFPLNDKARSANEWVKTAASWIWESVPDWEFDDSNYTTMPWALRDLVDDQEDYALPTTVFGIDRVEIKDINGNWKLLKAFDKSQVKVAYPEYYSTKGVPEVYDLVGNSVILKPAPDLTKVTETNGIRLYLSRTPDVFDSSSTTKEAGFNPMYHRIVSMGMALDYATRVGNGEKVTVLKRMLYGDPTVIGDKGMKEAMKDHYSHRHIRGFKTRIRPKRRSSI